jgi:Domain of unknown function (DUF4258)
MEIKYTPHAVERMMQRKISPREVELVLGDPDGKIEQSMHKVIYYKRIRKRRDSALAVVIVQKTKILHEAITVMVNFEV